MIYHLYHDESKLNGYWHGILLVPGETRSTLINYLQQVRDNTKYAEPIVIKKVRKNSSKIYRCAESWMMIAIGAMRKKVGRVPYIIHFGDKILGKLQYREFNDCLGLKFILFRSEDDHEDMKYLNSHADKVETTIRFGMKGGMHYLGSEHSQIEVASIHFDGYEHYRRHVDKNRIVGRLNGLRDYVHLDDAINIFDHTSDHRKMTIDKYGDCQLLQLTDLLIGAFRTQLGHSTQAIHYKLGSIAKLPLEAYQRGGKGYKNSRWSESFWMSQCKIVNERWKFSTIEHNKETNLHQLSIKF